MTKRWAVLLVVALGLLGACGDDDGDGATSATTAPIAATTTTTAPEPLRILVTNDDGVGAAGIDALVEALRKLPNTTITVVAPAANQSGTGGQTTDGDLTVTDAETAGGFTAKSVNGFPADAIVYALDQNGLATRPHVVISGINAGQNIGAFVDLSGTVGAARAAAQRGIPAVAVSQGLGEPPDYPSGVEAVLVWLTDHRTELLARDTRDTEPAEVTNLNIPTCPSGDPRPAIETDVDTTGANPLGEVDCTTPYDSPTSDVDAFVHGYIAQTDDLALTPAAP